MSIKATCPECKARFTLGDELDGKKIRCQKCQAIFGPVSRNDEEPAEKITSSPRTGTRLKKDEERPARRVKKPARSGTPVFWLAGAVLFMLLFIGSVIGGVVWMINKTTEVETAPPPTMPPPGIVSGPSIPNFEGKDGEPHDVLPEPFPPAGFPPTESALSEYKTIRVDNPVPDVANDEKNPLAAGGKMSREATAAVKSGTVYIRVTRNDGGGSGSGFFASPDAPNLVVTNAHVVGMLNPEAAEPTKIEVFVHSGQKDEKSYVGKLIGLDRFSDLAVIDIGAKVDLPKPLKIKPSSKVRELDDVFVFGFPLGERLGKEITIRDTSVSSLRHRDGILERIQTKGGMDPGNSGGPVVDTNGDLAGVAVSIILGREIQFAVPSDRVYGILYGRVSGFGMGQPVRKADKIVAPIHIQMMDPRGQINSVGVEVWAGSTPAGGETSRPASLTQPTALPGDSPRQRTLRPVVREKKAAGNAKTYGRKDLRGEVALPPLPAGKVYWVQPVWTRKSGQTVWGSATVYKGGEPILPKTVELRTRYVESENRRSVLLSVIKHILLDESDAEAITFTTTAGFSERVTGVSPTGATLAAFYQGAANDMVQNKEVSPDPTIAGLRASLSTMKARVQLDVTGNVTANQLVGAASGPGNDAMHQFHESVKAGMDAAYLPLPNRTVKPGDTWEVSQRTLNLAPSMTHPAHQLLAGARLVQLNMTCTYLGTRSTGGREEAVVGVSGRVANSTSPGSQVHGQMIVDVETGVIRSVELNVSMALPEIMGIFGGEARKNRFRLALAIRVQRNL
jgi:predicted Zn finger-like uncharacterized protein